MSRRAPAERREVAPDPVYGSRMLSKMINYLMEDGKKSKAEKIVYTAFEIMAQRTKSNPLEVFSKAMRNLMPTLEVRSRRVGGQSYQVPVEVRPSRKLCLATRWLLNAARARKGRPMAEKLAMELMDAANGAGEAMKKREDTHRMAESNRAFAHYRW